MVSAVVEEVVADNRWNNLVVDCCKLEAVKTQVALLPGIDFAVARMMAAMADGRFALMWVEEGKRMVVELMAVAGSAVEGRMKMMGVAVGSAAKIAVMELGQKE